MKNPDSIPDESQIETWKFEPRREDPPPSRESAALSVESAPTDPPPGEPSEGFPPPDGFVDIEIEPDPSRRMETPQSETPRSETPPAETPPPELATTVIRRRRKGVTTAVLVATLAILVALGATLFSWWFATPSSPVDDLGLGHDPEATAEAEVDPEQSAFLENRGGAEVESGAGSAEKATFTDMAAVLRLAGTWAFDLGEASQALGGPDPLVGVLGSEVVKRQERERLSLELFQVWSRDLPPYYTVLKLPEGRFLTFQDEDGIYRYVLEDLRIHGDDIFSFRLGNASRRRYAHRLSEDRTVDRRQSEPRHQERDPRWPGAPTSRAEPPREPDDRGPVIIHREPGPSIEALWQQARALLMAERYHTLGKLLDRILRQQPDHGPARRWRDQIPGWIAEQEEEITHQIQVRLGELTGGLVARDLDRVLAHWGGRADRSTRAFFGRRIEIHPRIRAWARLHSVEVYDGSAEFRATLTLEGRGGRRRDATIEEIPWRARFEDGVFASSFPGS